MKLPLSLLVLAIAAAIPAASATEQQSMSMESGQKTRLNPRSRSVIPDMPDAPSQDVPMMIAQASQGQRGDSTTRTLGVCRVVPNGAQLVTPTMEYMLLPQFDAQDYLDLYVHRTVTGTPTVTILQQPKHGILRLITEADRGTLFGSTADPLDPSRGLYAYLPEKGYLGKDSATVLVEIGGVKVKVVYFFQTTDGGTVPESLADRLCGKKGSTWKISANLDASGNSSIGTGARQATCRLIHAANC